MDEENGRVMASVNLTFTTMVTRKKIMSVGFVMNKLDQGLDISKEITSTGK